MTRSRSRNPATTRKEIGVRPSAPASVLSHLGPEGEARMVDVTAKPTSAREAIARGRVTMAAATARLVQQGKGPKGDVAQVARLAGLMAAKRTAELIPLCHPLPITGVEVALRPVRDGYEIEARVRTNAQTGVEMEALAAVAVAALTVYDMAKAADKSMVIGDIRLIAKRGGKSGEWKREGEI